MEAQARTAELSQGLGPVCGVPFKHVGVAAFLDVFMLELVRMLCERADGAGLAFSCVKRPGFSFPRNSV